ncbi:MAG: prenyltransferase/squalene oxidase repeat-containing protein, partial [Planctomycetota bacterium]
KGMLPIAIVGTEDFDVTQVDLATVQLMLVDPARGAYEDVCTAYLPLTGKASQYDCTEEGPDGFMDLTLKFDCQVIAEALEAIGGPLTDGEEILVTLTGNLLDEYGGTPIMGEDVVRIIKKGK